MDNYNPGKYHKCRLYFHCHVHPTFSTSDSYYTNMLDFPFILFYKSNFSTITFYKITFSFDDLIEKCLNNKFYQMRNIKSSKNI